MTSISRLERADAAAYASLAYPRHRPLLLGDLAPPGTTLAIGASQLGEPSALALAGPLGGDVVALHSVVVRSGLRRRGLATRLLEELEAELCSRGVCRLAAAHRVDRQHGEAVSRLLARRGFEVLRSVVELVYPVARALAAPALNEPCSGATVVELTPERIAPLLELREASAMAPANVAPQAIDPELSTLVALDGEVAACVLGHRVAADTAYIALLFVRPELRRSGLAGFATRSFLLRLLERRIPHVSCEVWLNNAACLPFADEKLAPYADQRAIVQISHKTLTPSR